MRVKDVIDLIKRQTKVKKEDRKYGSYGGALQIIEGMVNEQCEINMVRNGEVKDRSFYNKEE